MKKFQKRLQGFICNSFRKVKISNKRDPIIESLYDRRRLLRTKTDNDSKIALEKVENELAEKCGEKMFHKIKNEIKGLNGEEGGFNVGYLWKLNKKLSSKDREIPTMMMDSNGKILTTPEEIRNEAIKHYEKSFS